VKRNTLLRSLLPLSPWGTPAWPSTRSLVIKNPASIARYLAGIGEPTDLPPRSPDRGPPYWKSTILRRQAFGYEDA
jgi:hypothetical protein